MELKIQCSCGSRYKFDVEPVNGRVPAPAVGPVSAGVVAPETAPSAQPPAIAPPSAKVGLRLSSHAASHQPSGPASAPEAPAAPVPVPPARHVPHVPTLAPVMDESNSGDFVRGFAGAVAGALIGGVAYYLLFVHTDVRLKLIALGVGVLAGLGARLLGKDRSKELGVIAAVLSIGVIAGAQYLAVTSWAEEGELMDEATGEQKSGYEERVTEAKKVVAAIPNGTDQEIRLYLAKEMADEGEKPDPKSIELEEIQEFKVEELPHYRKLADGSYTREQYDKDHTVTLTAEERQEMKKEGERVKKWVFLAFLMQKFNLACIAGAAGISYKMIANA